MSVTLVDGSTLSIASAYATQFTVTAITNANPAVATLSASHGIIVGDFFELTSGWPGLDGRIFRASVVATNDVTLEGIDTTDTTQYPAGSGTGTGREISTWQSVGQVISISDEGGDQQFWEYQFMDQLLKRRVPTVQDPVSLNLVIAQDLSLAYLSTIRTAQATQTVRAARLVFRNSARMVWNAYWALGQFPKLELGTGVQRAITNAVTGLPCEFTT